MTYQQAKELVKERAASKYRGTALHLLQKLTNSLYSEQDNGDVEKRAISKKATTMCGWLGISDKQLGRLLDQIEEVHVVSRENRTITYTMSFQSLKGAEKTVEQVKRVKRKKNNDRAAKARDAREDQRTDALYEKRLGEIVAVGAPHQEQLLQHFVDGGQGPTSPAQKAAFERMALAKKVRDDAGRKVKAEKLVLGFMARNPHDPLTKKITQGKGELTDTEFQRILDSKKKEVS